MFGSTFRNDLLKLIFNATAIANLADNAASSPLANLYLSLHTADPGAGGDQTTSEIAYTGYARVAVARSGGGWTVTANSVSPAANIDFGKMTAGTPGTAYYAAIGTASSGAGKIIARAVLGQLIGGATSKASNDAITIPGHSLVVNDQVTFQPLPGNVGVGLSAGAIYYVKTVSGDDVTLSATVGGATIDITVGGPLLAFKVVTPIAYAAGVIPRLETGSTLTLV